MNTKKLLTVTVTVTITTIFVLVSNLASFSITEMLITPKIAFAQVLPVPSLPDGGSSTTDNQLPDTNSQSQLSQPATPTSVNIPPPTIQITSHQDGSQVPVGELTIQGTSSDNQESNCQVYADVNDISPLQNATAAGGNGSDDYSQWTFTYTENYQLIAQGGNELTAKISCFDNGGGAATMPLSEWHSVNVTGVAGGSSAPTPTMTQTLATTGETLGSEQGANIISAPTTSIAAAPSIPAIGPSGGSIQGEGDGGNGEENDDDGGDDDSGDDEGEDDGDDDDGGEGDDG